MFSETAIAVLNERYLLKNDKGEIIETPKQMFKRVANFVGNGKKQKKEFFEMMWNLEFLPNSPTLMNTNTRLGQLSACFVLPVEDSIDSIFTAVKNSALIHQSGGGTGFSFSRIRPKNDIVHSTKGKASGPVSFMEVFDKATDVVRQGGKRRGANMGILNVSHPDIEEFIHCKEIEGKFNNFNISVAVTDEFIDAVKKNKSFALINPRNKKAVKKTNAKKLFDSIAKLEWERGDPSLIFIDEMNRKNPIPSLGKFEATNPCGEVPLLPYESCNLGSINLSKFVDKEGKIDFTRLKKVIGAAVEFLDNIVDKNKFPLAEIEKMTKANRKIGLGVMGFADMLVKMGISYGSDESFQIAELLMKFISTAARQKSIELGKKKGNFPNFKKSIWSRKYKNMRNATVTSIAPTGTLSIIANCSSGIEPLFALVLERHILGGKRFFEINELFKEKAKKKKIYNIKLIQDVVKNEGLQKLKIDGEMKKLFVTSHDINYEKHIKMQAVFQKYVDNSISKTINLRASATVNDVKKAFMLAHELKCKGITLYRDKSKKEQVIKFDPSCLRGICPL
jgi:ribonucleoside-diphosphate reductase alpha chain